MDQLQEILGKEKEIQFRFPIMLISYVFYHVLFYYSLTPNPMPKPGMFLVFFGIVLHISHVIIVKMLHFEDKFLYAWLTLAIPVLVITILYKFLQKRKRKEEERIEKIKQSVRNEYENQMIQVPQTEFVQVEKLQQNPYSQRELMPDGFAAPVGGQTDSLLTVNQGGFAQGMNDVSGMGGMTSNMGGNMDYSPNIYGNQATIQNNVIDAMDPYAHMAY